MRPQQSAPADYPTVTLSAPARRGPATCNIRGRQTQANRFVHGLIRHQTNIAPPSGSLQRHPSPHATTRLARRNSRTALQLLAHSATQSHSYRPPPPTYHHYHFITLRTMPSYAFLTVGLARSASEEAEAAAAEKFGASAACGAV